MTVATDPVQEAPPVGTEPEGAQPHRTWRLLPGAVIALGAAATAWLLSLTRPGTFFNGDGGLKLLLVQQFARGELAPDLRLQAEPWVEEIWRRGFFPFDWPFTFDVGGRTFAWCPLPFEYLTAPAYAALGWRGLYAWPVLGLVGLWLGVWRLCRKLGLEPPWVALALFAVVFCSPITIYGAIFSEHTLGVALAMGGLALLVAPALPSPTWNGLLGGFVLGLAVWFRSELVWLAFVSAALLPATRALGIDVRGRGAFFGGLSIAGVGFLAWNAALYGDPLGMTSRPLIHGGGGNLSRTEEIAAIVPGLWRLFLFCGPAIGLAAVAAIVMLSRRIGSGKARAEVRFWAVLALAYVLGVVLVLPSAGGAGGKQFGPRYLFVAFPMASVLLALSSRALWERAGGAARAAMGTALAIGLGAGVWVNTVQGAVDLSSDYATRVTPLLDAVRAHPDEVVVVTHQYMAQELAAQFGAKRFFRARDEVDAELLASLLQKAGYGRFLSLSERSAAAPDALSVRRGLHTDLAFTPITCADSGWCLHEVEVIGADAR